jgi:sugar (pentulose or hexulose) kinase
MKTKVTAVFDIGKTNKKFFLFDKDYQEVYREYIKFDEIKDEDGFPCENLKSLQKWLRSVFNKMLESEEFDIKAINFSSYGASWVHLNDDGEILTPLYNYVKPLDPAIQDSFYKKYGPEEEFSSITGSPTSGMLNSGMQLYWIKYTKPEIYSQIRYSLHLPQYLSYIFTGIPISEYTSIGCHTALWDYEKKDYHNWVYKEEIDKKLPPIVSTETSLNMNYNGKRIKIGVGIHDSSSALLPYVRSIKKPFILVSTGTWSVSLNPFSKGHLTPDLVANGCLNYMRINGKPVKSSRVFLGNEYKLQVQKLSKHYGVPTDHHKTIKFDDDIFFDIYDDTFQHLYRWISIEDDNMPSETRLPYDSFVYAYHQLMIELVMVQVKAIRLAQGGQSIKKLYLDGGFSDNDTFVKLLTYFLRDMTLRTTTASLGSALGAAISISDSKLNSKFLKKNYSLKKHVPFILK